MTPPGYYTTATETLACDDGEYRAEWKPAVAATACSKCGDNIKSAAHDQLTTYDITDATGATTGFEAVRASAGSCCEYLGSVQLVHAVNDEPAMCSVQQPLSLVCFAPTLSAPNT